MVFSFGKDQLSPYSNIKPLCMYISLFNGYIKIVFIGRQAL